MRSRSRSSLLFCVLTACSAGDAGESGTTGTASTGATGTSEGATEAPTSTTGTPTGTSAGMTSTTDVAGSSSSGGDSSSSGSSSSSSGDGSSSSGGTTGVGPGCGNGVLDALEECDDGNQVDGDACTNKCLDAVCGDGVVQALVEACDDGNQVDNDACRNTCVAAACGDGVVQMGVEFCDEAMLNGTYNHCAADCTKLGPSCGDKVVDGGNGETCDDGNKVDGDGCSAACKGELKCANQGGGALQAENGTGMNKFYCYEQADSIDTRARKACESHFGIGACCIIPGGYSGLQWGQCGKDGGQGTYHFHPDPHPDGHCAPNYIVGDVVAPGWCGAVLGNFLD